MSVRIALIHAMPVAMEPIRSAFRRGWAEAEVANILDDSLSADRARDAELTAAMRERLRRLTHYAADWPGDRGGRARGSSRH